MKTLRAVTALAVFALLYLNAFAADTRSASGTQPVSNPWFLQAQLTTTGNNLYFGETVSISGNTIVTTGGGAVYVYVREGGRWNTMTQTATLTASDGSGFYSAAISGNTIVAGSLGANNSAGAAYVFVEPSAGWVDGTETATLTASDAAAGDFFGYSVAIAGNTIAVGGFQNNSVGITYPVGPGKVYEFTKPAAGWSSMTETAELSASDGVTGDDFGYSVAVLGDTIVAGAPNATVDGNEIEGAVYVFEKPASGWKTATETAKLTASDGTAISVVGFDVGISGNNIAALAFNQVYIFTRPAGGWVSGTQTAELQDPSGFTFALQSTAICDRYVLAGDWFATNHPVVDLYVEPSTGWANEAPAYRFRAPAANGPKGRLGWSTAIQGTTLVVSSLLNGGTGGNIIFVYGPS
jgi:hypothetical protein